MSTLDIRSTAERSADSSAYWKDRLGREWDQRCGDCNRTRIIINSEVLSLAEKQRFGYDDDAQPLCVYCFFAPPPSFKLPTWVTPRKPFQFPTRAATAVALPPPPMPVAETAAADSDDEEQDDDDGGVDMDGVAFDNDEREIDDADAELEKEAANDGAMLD